MTPADRTIALDKLQAAREHLDLADTLRRAASQLDDMAEWLVEDVKAYLENSSDEPAAGALTRH